MSRKTTSGADASRAASASAPLRHSPATANSGNAANSCRTPLRAAGSSSAIKALHSASFMIRLRDHLTIWRSQGCDCTTFRAPGYLERGALAEQGAKSLPRVLDPVALRDGEILVNTRPVVRDGELERGADATRGDDQAARVGAPRNAMTYRILDQVLQREARHYGGDERIADVEFGSQPIGESRLLNGDVLPDEFEFFSERDFIRAMAAERGPQHFTQLFDDAHRGLTLVVAHEHGDGVERVEEEVRVDLRL